MGLLDVAREWRERQDFVGKGGVIVIWNGVVNSWVDELRNPEHWRPGCIAIDESGNRWKTVGGTDQKGAERWQPL